MKVRWWVVGVIAVAAGSMFMIKHFVENKKSFLPFVHRNNEKRFGTYPHEMLETGFDDADSLV
jgi:hypothetical protein